MMDLKARAIRAAEERGAMDEDQRREMERYRAEVRDAWLLRRLRHLMYRVLDTAMEPGEWAVTEEAIPGIDWTRATIRAEVNGVAFGTAGVFGHDGRDIPVGNGNLFVWIPCPCGRETGPQCVGSLSGLGDLFRLWERCEACQTAPAPAENLPPASHAGRVQVDRERMTARRRQGGGLEVAR